MKSNKSKIATRIATPNDTHELCELLNEIILIGGTTAIEIVVADKKCWPVEVWKSGDDLRKSIIYLYMYQNAGWNTKSLEMHLINSIRLS